MRVFYNAIIVHLIFNLYVFYRGWQVLPAKKAYRVPYAALFIIELIVYLIGFIFNVSLPEPVLKPILLLGTSWMVLIGAVSGLLLAYDFLKLLGQRVGSVRKLRLESLRKRRFYFIISWLIVFTIMFWGNYRFWHPTVTELNLKINKEAEGLDKLRIVMVSDIHVGYLIDKKVLSMYVDRIMEQKPDIVLMAGDIIDYDLPPLIAQNMHEEFLRLKAPYGVYASTGNHEYRLNAEEKIAWLSEKAGMNVLRDQYVKIDDKFYIVGREDDKAPGRKSLSSIIDGIDKMLPVIVINHEPHSLSQESDQKVDLALYGHTHNGQIFPYNIVMSWIYEVAFGYKKKEDTHIYVSSGLGLSGPQYRIGTISEIVVVDLQFSGSRTVGQTM